MTIDQMQILPTKLYDLIMNWHAIGLSCFLRHHLQTGHGSLWSRP